MDKLDKWDSQLVWLSKGWVEKERGYKNLITSVKNMWSHRCAVYAEDVNLCYCAHRMIKILKRHDPTFIDNLLEMFSPLNKYSPRDLRYTTVQGYIENAVEQLLLMISELQIKDGKETVISLEPLDVTVLLSGNCRDES